MSGQDKKAPPAIERARRFEGQTKVKFEIEVYEGEQNEFFQCWRNYQLGDKFAERQALQKAEQDQGVRSLQHLVNVVMVEAFTCGQSYTVARALGSMYNGARVKADLFEWRGLDLDLVEHLIHVIRLHTSNLGYREIHTFMPAGTGGMIFERMIKAYGLEKRRRKA